MARSSSKKGNVKPFPGPETAPDSAPTIPEQTPLATPVDPNPPKRGRGRPPAIETGYVPGAIPFFQKIQKIDPKDWGDRAQIKVYRIYPVTNRLVSQDHKFVCIYGNPDEPPLTEERLKVDHGSGKYRLYLNYRNPDGNTREMDKTEVDIMDPRFPPNIPPGEWLDDPRNKNWAWARPKDPAAPAPPPPSAASSLADVRDILSVATEIRRDAREEMQPAQQTAAAPQPTTDPWTAAEKILTMRSENPMLTILQKQIDTLAETLKSERDARVRAEGELLRAEISALKEQLGKNHAPPADLFAQLEQQQERVEKFKKLFGIAEQTVEHTTRSKMPWWADIAKEAIGGIMQSPLMGILAQKMMQGPQANGIGTTPPHPAPIDIRPQPAGQAPQPGQPQNFMQFVESITPTMLRYLEAGQEGADFADWLYAGFPEQFLQVQNLEHPMMPGMKGAPVIIGLYRQSPYWQRIALHEPQFVKFVEDFCKWKPGNQEEIPEAETEDPAEDDAERIEV